MKAIETTATINKKGQLTLDQPLTITQPQSVRVIVLIPDNEEIDPEETPTKIIVEGIRQGLYEALNGQTIPFQNYYLIIYEFFTTSKHRYYLGNSQRRIK
jgi:hypothetical protein